MWWMALKPLELLGIRVDSITRKELAQFELLYHAGHLTTECVAPEEVAGTECGSGDK